MLDNLLAMVNGDGTYWAGQLRDPDKIYFDNWGEPFLYALIGFLVVFVGIALIIFIIWLVGFVMRKTNNLELLTKKKEKGGEKPQISPESLASEKEAGGEEDIPDEVKAAIVAAIMAYYQEKEEKCQFTVKRIKRL